MAKKIIRRDGQQYTDGGAVLVSRDGRATELSVRLELLPPPAMYYSADWAFAFMENGEFCFAFVQVSAVVFEPLSCLIVRYPVHEYKRHLLQSIDFSSSINDYVKDKQSYKQYVSMADNIKLHEVIKKVPPNKIHSERAMFNRVARHSDISEILFYALSVNRAVDVLMDRPIDYSNPENIQLLRPLVAVNMPTHVLGALIVQSTQIIGDTDDASSV